MKFFQGEKPNLENGFYQRISFNLPFQWLNAYNEIMIMKSIVTVEKVQQEENYFETFSR